MIWRFDIVRNVPSKMLLVISIKVLSKRLKKNQLFKDPKFRKMVIILMFTIAIIH